SGRLAHPCGGMSFTTRGWSLWARCDRRQCCCGKPKSRGWMALRRAGCWPATPICISDQTLAQRQPCWTRTSAAAGKEPAGSLPLQLLGLVAVFLRPGRVTQPFAGYCPVGISDGELRVEADGPVEIAHSFLVVLQLPLGKAAVIVRGRVLGIQLQGFAVAGNGPGIILAVAVGTAEVEVSAGRVRLQLHRLFPLGNGLLVLPQQAVSLAQVAVGERVVRFQTQRLLVVAHGPVIVLLVGGGAAAVAVNVAPVEVGECVLRIEFDGLAQVADRQIVIALEGVG